MGEDHERMLQLRVLWLEDDSTLRKSFGFIAEDLGANVRMVGSRDEADECLRSDRFDCIVCDYRLHGRNAESFVRRLVDEGHRVVVLTGDASRVPTTLPVPVFEKPIRVETLLEALVTSQPA